MSFFTEEFKKAISYLSPKEKDKLILRLLKKDPDLTKRLFFELVDTRSIEERRAIVEKQILTDISKMSERFYSVGYLNMDIRYLSGSINEHVKITKDKYGNVSLNLLLLNEALRLNRSNILTTGSSSSLHKFCIAIIARVFKVLMLIIKMDDDLLLDFKDDLTELGRLIADNEKIMNTAIENGLDINWLLDAEIPHDLLRIYKELRNDGFLR